MENYNNGDVSINGNVPSCDVEFKMSNKDENVKQLRSRYNIPTEKITNVKMHIDGDLKGSSMLVIKVRNRLSKEDEAIISH